MAAMEIESEVERSAAAVNMHPGQEYHDELPLDEILSMHELKSWSFYRALIAEFVGTLLYIYITVATILGEGQLARTTRCGGVGTLGIAWAFGGMYFVLVYCTTGVSGGHLNPAVTLGLFLGRKLSLLRAIMYTIVQCLGAVCGAAIAKLYVTSNTNNLTTISNCVQPGYSAGIALAAEILGTFVLVYTVFSAMIPKHRGRGSHVPVLVPLPIGFAVFMIHLATIPITRTGINPARSFATAAMFGPFIIWKQQWIFWLGPLIGAVLAGGYHVQIMQIKTKRSVEAAQLRSNYANII